MLVLQWSIVALIVLIAFYAGLHAFGAWRWKLAAHGLVERLEGAQAAAGTARYDAEEIADLPAPVRRYLQLALTDGQPIVRTADLAMTGIFNLSVDVPKWKPFTSRQHVTTRRRGFFWDARIMMFPGVPILVYDAYIAGEGMLRPSILGLYSMGDIRGGGEIARGELMRFFAEAVWYPTALLPSQGVTWVAVDDASAKATLTDGPISLTMLFRFGADDMVASIHADSRGGTLNGKMVMMPWECRMSNYKMRDGMRVPFRGEAAYVTPDGEKPYFRGTITQIAYQFVS